MDQLVKPTPNSPKTYKPSRPFTSKVLEKYFLSPSSADDFSFHLTLSLEGSDLHFLEGQSIGVIPPGEREPNIANKLRLYSVASSHQGELSKTASLGITIKRTVFEIDNVKHYGLCSNYLSKLEVGSELQITGPVGRILLPPLADDVDLLIFATGTGIAPFRGMLQEFSRRAKPYLGQICCFFGFKNEAEAVYCNSINNQIIEYSKKTNAEVKLALSRVHTNSAGGKIYVADLLDAETKTLVNIIKRQNFAVYICGIKGMQDAILNKLSAAFDSAGLNGAEQLAVLKASGRLNVEVY